MEKLPLFIFKKISGDFMVEEILPFQIKGKGDAFFVYFEKRNTTTMEVVQHLCKRLHVSRLTLGIAGLKDKDAISRQWISIYKTALKKMGGEEVFLEALSHVARIITTKYHERPLSMKDKVKNKFAIRLRGEQNLSQDKKEQIIETIKSLGKRGFANFFGSQRFGFQGKNLEEAKDMFQTKKLLKDKFDRKFKLQSYASFLFNRFVQERLASGEKTLDGEFVMTSKGIGQYDASTKKVFLITQTKSDTAFALAEKTKESVDYVSNMQMLAPVFGWNLLIADPKTTYGKLQQDFFKNNGCDQAMHKIFQQEKIYGIYRPIRNYPQDMLVRFQKNDILLSFVLEGGTYASIFIDLILKNIG